jgi:hypothetical protein
LAPGESASYCYKAQFSDGELSTPVFKLVSQELVISVAATTTATTTITATNTTPTTATTPKSTSISKCSSQHQNQNLDS